MMTRIRWTVLVLLLVLAVGAAEEKKPRVDVQGDPLPDGVLARLGSARLRHGDPVVFVAYLPGGKTLLAGGADGTLRVWDLKSGKEQKHFSHADNTQPRNVPFVRRGNNTPLLCALSDNGKVLATSVLNAMSVRLWDPATGKELRTVNINNVPVNAISLTADGKTLAASAADGAIRLYNVADGKEVRSFGLDPQGMNGGTRFFGGPMAMRFSPDGKTVVLAGLELENRMVKRSLRAWESATGKMLYRVEDGRNSFYGATPVFSPDGKTLALASMQGEIHLLDAASGKEIRKIRGTFGRLDGVVYSADGKELISRAAVNGSLGIWEAATGKEVRAINKAAASRLIHRQVNNPYNMGGLALSADGKQLAAADGNVIRLVELATGKDVFESTGHQATINGLYYLDGGKKLLSQSFDGTLRLWDPASGKETGQIKVPDNAYTFHLSPDGKHLAVEGTDGMVRLLNTADGKELQRFRGEGSMPRSCAFSADGKLLAMRSQNDPVTRVYSTETGKSVVTLGKPAEMNPLVRVYVPMSKAMAFSPDGSLLLVPGAETGLVLWEIPSGQMRREIAVPPNVQVRDACFSRDGRMLAIDLGDNRVVVHEIASGVERMTYLRKGDEKKPVNETRAMFYPNYNMLTTRTVAFSADGRRVALACDEGAVHVWDVLSGKEIGRLAGHLGEVSALAFSPDGKALATGGDDAIGLVWDLTALKPEPAPAVKPEKADLEKMWAELQTADGKSSLVAMSTLTAAPERSLPFLDSLLKQPEEVEPGRIEKLITDLDARRFVTRKKAQEELERAGGRAAPALRKALKGSASQEARKRIEELLEKCKGQSLAPAQLQVVRAVEVLERIGTREAREILERLAKGPTGALETNEARATLERMK
jgi:WD40 repeat protein